MDNNQGVVVTTSTSVNASVSNNFTSDTLISINEVPIKFRHIFSNYIYFNRIQSGMFRDIFDTDDSIVVSAPTGSGKTVAFELAIVKLLHSLDVAGQDYNSYKIIYIAPMKALCEERLADWHKKFSSVGLNCASVTGDSDIVSFQSLVNLNLIITTPEKWDSLTRRWKSNKRFVSKVALFMIDEVHLLNDESRGPTLEAIVSRMKTIQDNVENANNVCKPTKIRFLAVSATIPNVEDIAAWLKTHGKSARHYSFGDETRPVKLNKIVIGYHYSAQSSSEFKFDMMLSYKLQGIIMQHSQGKATLIFCSTRKSVEMTAKHLTQNLTIRLNADQKKILEDAASKISTAFIRTALVNGVACHHAGMLTDNRRTIEELFRNGDLPVIVTTSTLAMGVNLPAHLVIIKGTKYYAKGEYLDYDNSVLLQMIGRAGRPQFDSSATAVILTKMADKNKFENMVGGIQPIESSLHKHLTEHLNAEVVLRTITDLGVAMHWLTSTFLYVRARNHPKHYGLPVGSTTEQLDRKLLDMCQIEINKLAKVGMVSMDQNVNLMPTAIGSLMAKYCIHFETMKLFKEVAGTEVLQQILGLISKCHEFSDLYLRVNDKKTLNLLNKCKNRETIRYPLSGKIKTVDMKINCIIQAVFGCLQIVETSLLNEAQKIMRIGERVSKALAEYLESKENCFQALLNAIILAKCFHARIWENSPYISKQLEGIGIVMSGHLVAAGKTSFQALLETNPRNLEMIIHKKSPIGDDIQGQIKYLPTYKLALEETKISSTVSTVKVIINLLNSDKLQERMTLDPNSVMHLLIGDDHNNILKYEKYTHSFMVENPNIEQELGNNFNSKLTVKAYFISENWAGIDCNASLDLFPPEKKKAVKSKPKKVVAQSENCVVTEENLAALSNVTNKKYIYDYFNLLKKSKAQIKTLEAKALTAEEENKLLGNDTLDEENMNQVDELGLLDSSVDSHIEAVLDLAESEYVLEKQGMSDNLKKLLSSTTDEYLKVQNVLDENCDTSVHFKMTKPQICNVNDGKNREANAKKLFNSTIEEYLETEAANADRDNKNARKSKMSNVHNEATKFKQLRPSILQNEYKIVCNSSNDVDRWNQTESSVKEFEAINSSASGQSNDRKNEQQRYETNEFINSKVFSKTLQRDAALNEYYQHVAQPVDVETIQGTHRNRGEPKNCFQAVENLIQASSNLENSNSATNRNQNEVKNCFRVEPQNQVANREQLRAMQRNQTEFKSTFQIEPPTQESSNLANSNGEPHQDVYKNQVEHKNEFKVEAQIKQFSNLVNLNAEWNRTVQRNQIEPKYSFKVEPQTQESANFRNLNPERFQAGPRNQIEAKHFYQVQPQTQASSNFANPHAERFQVTPSNPVEDKNQFTDEPPNQVFSNLANSNGEHLQAMQRNQVKPKYRFHVEAPTQVSSNYGNSNAGMFQAALGGQIENNNLTSNIFHIQNNAEPRGSISKIREETFQNATNKDYFTDIFNPKETFSSEDFWNESQLSQISNLDESENITNYDWNDPHIQIKNKPCNSPINNTSRLNKYVSSHPQMMKNYNDGGWDSSLSSSSRGIEETNDFSAGKKPLSMKSFPSLLDESDDAKAGSTLPYYSPATKAKHQNQIRVDLRNTFSLEPKKRFKSDVPKHIIEPDSTNSGEYKCVEILSPKRQKLVEATDSSRKSIKWSSPLVTSPGVKYSPKLTNTKCNVSAPSTSKGQEFKTPKRTSRAQFSNFPLKTPKNLVDFPITDKQCAYVPTSQSRINTVSDILSQSFLDVLSSDVNPDKKPKQFFMQGLGSYTRSQILEKPSTVTSNTQKRDNVKKENRSEASQNQFASISPINLQHLTNQNYLEGNDFLQTNEQFRYPIMKSEFEENYSAATQQNYAADERQFLKNRIDAPNIDTKKLSTRSQPGTSPTNFMRPQHYSTDQVSNFPAVNQQNYNLNMFDPADETQYLKNRLETPNFSSRQFDTRSQPVKSQKMSMRPQNFSTNQDYNFPMVNQQNYASSMFDAADETPKFAKRGLGPRSHPVKSQKMRAQDFSTSQVSDFPQRSTNFFRHPEYSRIPDFQDEPREFYDRYDLLQRCADFSETHANLPQRCTEFQERRTRFPERHPDFPQRYTDFTESQSDLKQIPSRLFSERDFVQIQDDFSNKRPDFNERLDFSFQPSGSNFVGNFSATQFDGLPRRQNLMSPMGMENRGASWDAHDIYGDDCFINSNPNFYERYNSGNYQ